MNIKKFFKDFVNSFKPKISWLYIMLFDFLFYGISILLVKAVGSYLSKKSASIILPTGDLMSMPAEQLEPILLQLRNYFIATIVSVVLAFIIILVAWSLTRGLIYSLLLKKKYSKSYFKKSILLNLFLSVDIIILLTFFVSIGLLLQDLARGYVYVFYAVFLVIGYYLSLNYIFFTRKNHVFESVGKALTFGTKNLPKLIIPCLIILIISTVLSNLVPLIIPVQILSFASLVIFVAFMAWARTYFVHEVEKI